MRKLSKGFLIVLVVLCVFIVDYLCQINGQSIVLNFTETNNLLFIVLLFSVLWCFVLAVARRIKARHPVAARLLQLFVGLQLSALVVILLFGFLEYLPN